MCTIVEQSLRSLRFFSKSKMQKRMYILLSVQKYDHNHISLCRQNISKKTQQETGNNGGLSEGKQKIKEWRRRFLFTVPSLCTY